MPVHQMRAPFSRRFAGIAASASGCGSASAELFGGSVSAELLVSLSEWAFDPESSPPGFGVAASASAAGEVVTDVGSDASVEEVGEVVADAGSDASVADVGVAAGAADTAPGEDSGSSTADKSSAGAAPDAGGRSPGVSGFARSSSLASGSTPVREIPLRALRSTRKTAPTATEPVSSQPIPGRSSGSAAAAATPVRQAAGSVPGGQGTLRHRGIGGVRCIGWYCFGGGPGLTARSLSGSVAVAEVAPLPMAAIAATPVAGSGLAPPAASRESAPTPTESVDPSDLLGSGPFDSDDVGISGIRNSPEGVQGRPWTSMRSGTPV
ncbi:hypothetical protein DFR70_101441 [Nocardia tenerifensis]|uniref:Uncharacterized protein n=1 Tax=Nocardia tenerifensis TaxID=228006 RepID=A0A318KMU1_9NOCA|nr:hypothetical protein DFR70_101441 [Nocardia tenerifensis]